MKLELDDNAGTTICICVLALLLAATSIAGCSITEGTKRRAFDGGYSQIQDAGGQGMHWEKK